MTHPPNSPIYQSTDLPTSQPPNPYVGPRTFSYEQRHLFFGREREARDLLARVLSERLLLFYAQSGAGKSSLINTRLIPALQEKNFVVLPVARVSGEPPAGIERVDNIFAFNLMLSIVEDCVPAQLASVTLIDFLARLARRTVVSGDGRERKIWLYDAEQAPATGGSQRYALIVDQFEEIITAHPGRWREREAFFHQLDAAMQADPNLWVVLTLREDYVAALDPYASLLADRLRARFLMQHMKAEAALEAVRRPAELAGRPFAPGVAEKLVDDLRQIRVPGQESTVAGEYVQPVQLEVVCFQLWEELKRRNEREGEEGGKAHQITLEDLAAAGDVNRALTQFYEETLAVALADPAAEGVSERQLRTWFDQELITSAGTRGLVIQGATGAAGLPNDVVDILQRRFLVHTETRGGDVWIELVHDRLVEPIRASNAAWFPVHLSALQRQAALWDEQGRSSGLLLRDAALAEAEAWAAAQDAPLEAHERDFLEACHAAQRAAARERQQTRRVRILAISAALLSVLAVGAAFIALRLSNDLVGRNDALVVAINDAEEALARAEYQTRRAKAGELVAQAENAIGTNLGNPDLPLLLAGQAVSATYEVDGYVNEQARDALVKAMAAVPPWRSLASELGVTFDWAQFAADGTRLVLSDSSESSVILWDAVMKREIARYEALDGYEVTTRDGRMFLTEPLDGERTQFWRASDGTAVADLPITLVWDAVTSPNEEYGVTFDYGGRNSQAMLWDLATHERLADLGGVQDAVFSSDSGRLWAINDGSKLLMLDATTGEELPLITEATGWEWLELQGNIVIASSSSDDSFSLWNARSGDALNPFGNGISIMDYAYSPVDDQIAIVGEDGGGQVLNASTGTVLYSISDAGVEKVKYSNTGELLAIKSQNDGWRLLSADEGQVLNEFAEAIGIWFDQRDELLLVINSDRSAQLVELATNERVELGEVGGNVDDVLASFSDDGQRLAMLDTIGFARVWDTTSGQESFQRRSNSDAGPLSFSPNGRYLYTDSEIWDIDGERRLFSDRELWLTSFSGDGSYVILAAQTSEYAVFDTTTHFQILQLRPQDDFPNRSVRQVGDFILTWDDNIRLWSSRSGEEILGDQGFTPLELATAGDFVIGLNRNRRYSLRDLPSGTEWFVMGEASPSITWPPVISTDDKLAAIQGVDSLVYLWDIEKQQMLFTLSREPMECVRFSPNGQYVVTVSQEGILYVWRTDLEGEAVLPPISGLGQSDCENIQFSSKGGMLIAPITERQGNQTSRIWNLLTAQEMLTEYGPFERVVFSPDSAVILTIGTNGEYRLWDAERQQQRIFPDLSESGKHLCFIPETGQVLANDCNDPFLIESIGSSVWDLETGKEIRLAEDGTISVLSPNGQWVVAFSNSTAPRVWNLSEQSVRFSLPEGIDEGSAAFNPSATILAAVDGDKGVAYMFDTDTGRETGTVPIHQGQSITEISSDGTLMLVSDERGTDVIDTASGRSLWRFTTDGAELPWFSPDGRFLMQWGGIGMVIWPARPELLLDWAASLIQRDPPVLTAEERKKYALD